MKGGIVTMAAAMAVCAALVCVAELRAQEHADTNGSVVAEVTAASASALPASSDIFTFERMKPPREAALQRGRLEGLPPLFRFMLAVSIYLVIPALFKQIRMPAVVALIIAGILSGPYVFKLVSPSAPVLAMLADVGRLLLLFYAGLEVDLTIFSQAKWRATFFGVATFMLPCAFGILLGLGFGHSMVAAVLIGSLLASHTLLGYPIVQYYGLVQREAVVITIGATIFTDILSLTILTLCVSVHKAGLDLTQTSLQLVEIGVYIAVVLFGLGKLARWFFTTFKPAQDVHMLVLLFIVSIAALLAEYIHMEGIVGAFIAGLAVNRALHGTETHRNIEVLGNTMFLPAFFFSIGLAMNLPEIARSIAQHFWFVVAMSAGLIASKFAAAWLTGARFHYAGYDRLNMWSLSMPQVAATIAAALVAYETINAAGIRLINQGVLSSVLVMVIVTAIGGPILTQIFCAKIKAQQPS